MFLNNDEKDILADRYDTPGLRYGDLKKELFEKIIEYFSPYRKKRDDLLKNIDFVHSSLNQGAQKASNIANGNIEKIRNSMGLKY